MPTINKALLKSVEPLAWKAGEAIMRVSRHDFAVEVKTDKMLTETDTAAHIIIARGLQIITP